MRRYGNPMKNPLLKETKPAKEAYALMHEILRKLNWAEHCASVSETGSQSSETMFPPKKTQSRSSGRMQGIPENSPQQQQRQAPDPEPSIISDRLDRTRANQRPLDRGQGSGQGMVNGRETSANSKENHQQKSDDQQSFKGGQRSSRQEPQRTTARSETSRANTMRTEGSRASTLSKDLAYVSQQYKFDLEKQKLEERLTKSKKEKLRQKEEVEQLRAELETERSKRKRLGHEAMKSRKERDAARSKSPTYSAFSGGTRIAGSGLGRHEVADSDFLGLPRRPRGDAPKPRTRPSSPPSTTGTFRASSSRRSPPTYSEPRETSSL